MSETIQLGKRLRPNAKWGFYGFPYCNANVGMKTELECNEVFRTMNNW